MSRLFPIQPYGYGEKGNRPPHPTCIPWPIADLAYSVYSHRYGSSQTLERLGERGGFSAGEMDEFLPDWRDRADALNAAHARIKELEGALLAEARAWEVEARHPPDTKYTREECLRRSKALRVLAAGDRVTLPGGDEDTSDEQKPGNVRGQG